MFKKLCSFLLVFALLCTLCVNRVSAQTEMVNLFHTTNMIQGFYNGTGSKIEDNGFRCSPPIAVTKGDVITFGSVVTAQGFHLVTMSDEATYTGEYGLAGGKLTKLYDIDSTNSIMQFTVPENVAFIRLVVKTTNVYHYVATKNRAFTVAELNAYCAPTNTRAMINLYDANTAIQGHYDGTGKKHENNTYRTSDPIPVAKGDVITFGTALVGQGFHLVTMSDEATYTGEYGLSGGKLTKLHDMGNSSAILQFTVPDNVAYVRMIARTEYANHYLVTKNRPFSVWEMNTFLDSRYTNLFDITTATQGFVNKNGTESTDDTYRTTPAIAVKQGDIITLAGAYTKQGFHIVGMTNNTTCTAEYTLGKGISKVEDLDDNTCIMNFVVPTGISHIRVIARTQYVNAYLVTKNHIVTKYGYNAYFFGGKKTLFLGDSISYGSADSGRAWAYRMSGSLGIVSDNQSISGWSVSTARKNRRIVDQMQKAKYNSYDYVIMEGGTNDAWESYPVGEMTSSYNPEDFNIDTFAGALEELFYTARNRFPTARFGFIIIYKMPLATKGNVNDMEDIANVTIEICKKWNVEYLDLYHDDYVNNTLLEVNTTKYIADTVHPNPEAYNRLTPYIEQWFKTIGETPAPQIPDEPDVPDVPDEPDVPDVPDVPETPSDLPEEIPYGDVNGDEKVDAKDALAVLKFAVGKTILTETEQKAAEVDGKYGINAKDALEILKYAVKKIEKFPIQQ